MIDAHIHVVDPRLPGAPALKAPDGTAFDGQPEPLAALLRAEMKAADVDHALAMGRLSAPDGDALGINGTLRLATLVPGLHAIGAADPTRTDRNHLDRAREQLKTGKVRALKGYLGYLPHGPDSPGYRPYIELAAEFKIPFVFHTGDTYAPTARVKYAHPLLVDEVAVDHRDVDFVLAHFGNPWLVDAGEVVYKNPNVWADLSGLVVGDEATLRDQLRLGFPPGLLVDSLREMVLYTGKPERFLYGSDWPLAPMTVYRDLIKKVVPEDDHRAVFEENARKLFKLT